MLVHGRVVTTLGLLMVFLALQFLVPARLVIGGMGAAGRPSVAVGVLLAFLWLVSAIFTNNLPRSRQPIRWAVGLFLLAQLVGNVVGFDRLPSSAQASSADRWLIATIGFVGVCLATADGISTREELDRLLRAVVALAGLMSVVGALQFFGVVDLTQYIRIPGLSLNSDLIGVSSRGNGAVPRVAGTANHYIEFGVVLALVLPVALHYALFSPPGHTRWVRWCAVGLVAVGIPLSISRSAMLAVAVAMTLIAVVWPWRQRYNAMVIAVMAVAVFHVLNRGVLGTIRALFTNAENDPSVTARIERTATVVELWEQRPVLGWGAGMVTPEEFLLLDNQIYVFLIAGGIVGVMAFLSLFMIPYVVARSVRLRGRDQETRHLGQTLAVTMPTAVMASATFDSFSFATFVGVTAILIGAIGALLRLDGTTVRRPLQPAAPGDSFVTTPLTANLRQRLRAARPVRGPRT
ncbi:O-antigen ligase family protein [Janibacter cremeus]|uniref:O-antigen ligase family protein n=1 Tax=Janibacter cremeus TaxID=1285192 RepID=UPI0023F6B4E2|nr:O-antigen ligase family protein [Janibacter cremeus]WEV76931.1 O-antigen ligase family protein [Janibacter cremeus]